MTHNTSIALSVTVAVVIPVVLTLAEPPQPNRGTASNLLTVAGEGFRILETDHFVIAYDTSYEALRPLIGRLEGTYDAILRFLKASGSWGEAPKDRFEVILFDGYEDFTRYLGGIGLQVGSVAGIYHQQSNIASFCNMLSNPDLQRITQQVDKIQGQLRQLKNTRAGSGNTRQRRKNLQRNLSVLRSHRDALVKRFNRLVVQHEAAHQMFFNLGVHVRGAANPSWLVEGLACQFEVPQAGLGGGLAQINHVRLADFRDALRAGPDAKIVDDDAYEKTLGDGNLVALADLISDPKLFSSRGSNTAFRYAQAWALVYYLNRKHPDSFVKYLRRLGERRPGEVVGRGREIDEFRSAFGEPDEAFQRAWSTYMLGLRFDRREAGR